MAITLLVLIFFAFIIEYFRITELSSNIWVVPSILTVETERRMFVFCVLMSNLVLIHIDICAKNLSDFL